MVFVDSFYSFSKVNVISSSSLQAVKGVVKDCALQFTTEDFYIKQFQALSRYNVEMVIVNEDGLIKRFSTNIPLSAIVKPEQTVITNFKVTLPKGKYAARFSLPTSIPNTFFLK